MLKKIKNDNILLEQRIKRFEELRQFINSFKENGNKDNSEHKKDDSNDSIQNKKKGKRKAIHSGQALNFLTKVHFVSINFSWLYQIFFFNKHGS